MFVSCNIITARSDKYIHMYTVAGKALVHRCRFLVKASRCLLLFWLLLDHLLAALMPHIQIARDDGTKRTKCLSFPLRINNQCGNGIEQKDTRDVDLIDAKSIIRSPLKCSKRAVFLYRCRCKVISIAGFQFSRTTFKRTLLLYFAWYSLPSVTLAIARFSYFF